MRKPPQQARSRRMVERLIDATARTIAEEGLAAATTARIAEVAGVSIGSLYQYFGDKEQLYAALLERMTAELVMLVDQHSRQLDSQPLRDWVAGLLDAVWMGLEADQGLYLRVLRHWPQLDVLPGMDILEQKLLSVLSLYAAQRPAPQAAAHLPARLYLLVNSVLFTLVRYISHPSPLVSREALIEAFSELVARALQ